MKRSNKKEFDYNYLIIVAFCICLVLLILKNGTVFGSNIDWFNQHTVFPDYFRKLFYATKNPFPNFALQIGAGQNIYNFSYYGLYNPLLMLSILFKIVPMKIYIIAINIFLYILFGLLLYYFFKDKTTKKLSLVVTLILLMSSTVLFHFHKHFMFVNYLPFLVLALIGVDKFYKCNKKSLIAFSIFMIITSSYYYSICSIIVICIYALYKYLEVNDKIIPKELFKKVLNFSIPVIIGILSAALLILPTFFALKSGREDAVSSVKNISKLIPFINLKGILYDNYSIGLTFISLLALVIGLTSKEKKVKVLSLILIILIDFPLFIYILNGNLYLRNKVLIPFIPLFGLLLIDFISRLINKSVKLKTILLTTIIITILSIITKFKLYCIYIDALIVIIAIILFYKDHISKRVLYTVFLLISLLMVSISNVTDSYVTKEDFNNSINSNVENNFNKVLSKKKELVRSNNLENTLSDVNSVYDINYNQTSLYSSVYNQLYRNFYTNVFKSSVSYRNNLITSQNNDILFQTFMGVKYLYTDKKPPIGYQKISKKVYQNNNVFPVLYGRSKLINEKDFDKLNYPDTIENLFGGTIVKSSKTNTNIKRIIKKENISYKIINSHDVEIKNNNDHIEVKALSDESNVSLAVDRDLKNKILIIEFSIIERSSCHEGDLSITIDDIKNNLTCKQWLYKNNNKVFHYVISNNDKNNLKINFNPGLYKINNINTYLIDYEDIKNISNDVIKFNLNSESNNDKITGNINMPNNGYFVTSIPYDKGFKVKVDNQIIETEIVNKAFLGFKLQKGVHDIEITYRAPYQKESLILTVIGIIGFIGLIYFDIKRKD